MLRKWRRTVDAASADTSPRPETRVPSPEKRELGADDRFEAGGAGRLVKAGGAVDAVAIEQRHRRIAKQRRAVDERLGQAGGPEEAEGGGGVEFDVHGGARDSGLGDREERSSSRRAGRLLERVYQGHGQLASLS
jgi:hypothetical protein